jgi:hypothetical protein
MGKPTIEGTGSPEMRHPQRTHSALPHWASRTPGHGEEKGQTEFGGLGKAACQGGAVLDLLALSSLHPADCSCCDVVSPKHAPGQVPSQP